MNAALEAFRPLQWSTAKVSLVESYLTAKWLEANGRYPDPSINDANDAVAALFELSPNHALGRLRPFRYDWLSADQSGRKTVWNNTTRGPKLATSIFQGNDLRRGLLPNASAIVGEIIADNPLPPKQSLIALVLRDHDFGPGDDWSNAEQLLLRSLSLSQVDLDTITSARPLDASLLGEDEWSIDDLGEAVAPPATVAIVPPKPGGNEGVEREAVVVDVRVERMLRRCIQHYPFLLLVGPPGTGKGTLVRWLIDQVARNPSAFGFDPQLCPNPTWRTPDESWTSFELVGGLAPDEKARLRWSNGLLINSLKEQRWLVLDETNRADLDKIMGPLLTWLSDQEIEVGRTKPHGGKPVQLGWADAATSATETPDPDTGEPTRFLAGRDWRMLGTYNPQDAQRVFRMGQALSRRFVVVPVPALMPGQFAGLVDETFPDLPEDARAAMAALYSAHHSRPETLLGPAVFLRMGEYLNGVPDTDIPDHLAEAYVANVGKFISAFDDGTFDALGTRVVEDEQAMPAEQWTWISAQRMTLG